VPRLGVRVRSWWGWNREGSEIRGIGKGLTALDPCHRRHGCLVVGLISTAVRGLEPSQPARGPCRHCSGEALLAKAGFVGSPRGK